MRGFIATHHSHASPPSDTPQSDEKKSEWRPLPTPLAHSTRVTIGQLLQTGMLFIITQQLQPCCIIIDMHSHDAWIIAIIAASPLV